MIYLIITSTIHNVNGLYNPPHRKERYLHCISRALQLLPPNIKPIIVENSEVSSSYLDGFENCPVLYTHSINMFNPNVKYKGNNELHDVKEAIKYYNIQDDDIVIKLTGRYELLNDSFFRFIQENENNYDAFIKFYNVCTKRFMYDDCTLGLIAVRCKYLRNFSYTNQASSEVELSRMVRNNIDKSRVCEIGQLHMRCCFAEDHRLLDV
jgi:hypothetical protein